MVENRPSMRDAMKLSAQRQLCDKCRTSVRATGQIPLQFRVSDRIFDDQLLRLCSTVLMGADPRGKGPMQPRQYLTHSRMVIVVF